MSNLKNIILLDDDPNQHTLMAEICKQIGFKYFAFTDCKSYLEEIGAGLRGISFLDVNLTEGKDAGFLVLEAVRSKVSEEMPVVILSRRSSFRDISYALEAGANDYLIKPIDPLLVQHKIFEIMDSAVPNPLVFKKIKNKIEGELTIELSLFKVDEVYLYFKSNYFFLKNAKVKIKNKVIEKIFNEEMIELSVHDCRLDEGENVYLLTLSKQDADTNYFNSLKAFLLENM